MNGVVLFAHGSLLCGAGETLAAHAAELKKRGVCRYVEAGFLNYSKPTFADAVRALQQQGVYRVCVVPYFLVPGKFVQVDLPQAIEEVRAEFSQLEFVTGEALGASELLAEALVESAAGACGLEGWGYDLLCAARHCRDYAECPLYATAGCPHLPGWRGEIEPPAPLEPTGKHGLLVMVHGSPRSASNKVMYEVVEEVRSRNLYDCVLEGFLECNEPSIAEAVDLLAQQNVQTITAVPYFLHTGTHVAEDLPALLREGERRHKEIRFRMGSFIGRSSSVCNLLELRCKQLCS